MFSRFPLGSWGKQGDSVGSSSTAVSPDVRSNPDDAGSVTKPDRGEEESSYDEEVSFRRGVRASDDGALRKTASDRPLAGHLRAASEDIMLGFSLSSSASAPDLTAKDVPSSEALQHNTHGSAMDLSSHTNAKASHAANEATGGMVGFGGGQGGMGGYNPAVEERRRSRMRMALEYHTNVLPSEGGIILPKGTVSKRWASFGSVPNISSKGRDFIFAGEQVCLLLYIAAPEPLDANDTTDIDGDQPLLLEADNTPPRDKGGGSTLSKGGSPSTPVDMVLPAGLTRGPDGALVKDLSSQNRNKAGRKKQGQARRSLLMLESVKRSHFLVKLTAPDAPPVRRRSTGSSPSVGRPAGERRPSAGLERTALEVNIGQHGCSPLPLEQANFDPRAAGGIARRVLGMEVLPSGDFVVALEVAINPDLVAYEASLEVLQYERYDPIGSSGARSRGAAASSPGSPSTVTSPSGSQITASSVNTGGADTARSQPPNANSNNSNPLSSADLFQWLLPLEGTPSSPFSASLAAGAAPGWLSPPRSTGGGPSAGLPPPGPSAMGFSFSSSFAGSHQRMPSSPPRLLNDAPLPANAGGAPGGPHGGPPGGDEVDLQSNNRELSPKKHRISTSKHMGNAPSNGPGPEGLLSFRGASLEPQRFTAQCGLEGAHVPGRRWTRQVAVLQPLGVESHICECGTQDLICVLVENVLPRTGMASDVELFVESLVMVMECRSTATATAALGASSSSSRALPMHVASMDVGHDVKLPIRLRPGEQHSFILRPQGPTGPSDSSGLPGGGAGGGAGAAAAGGSSHGRAESSVTEPSGLAMARGWGSSPALVGPDAKPPPAPTATLHERRPSGTLSFFGGGGSLLGMGSGPAPTTQSPVVSARDSTSRSFGSAGSLGNALEFAGAAAMATERRGSGGDGAAGTPSSSSSSGGGGGGEGTVDPLQFSIVIACRCSHSASPMHFRHPLSWRPRAPRDLLLSVSLEPSASSATHVANHDDALFAPQVATLRATNLTSNEISLTLLAPSALGNSAPMSSTVSSFPTSPRAPSSARTNQDDSVRRRPTGFAGSGAGGGGGGSGSGYGRSDSLPPIRRMESVIGASPLVVVRNRNSNSGVDTPVQERRTQRTHLWLQSAIPLGKLPPHSTTAVKCDLLPLTDGIITLDTIHMATQKQNTVYFPEQPLQVFCGTKLAPSSVYPL